MLFDFYGFLWDLFDYYRNSLLSISIHKSKVFSFYWRRIFIYHEIEIHKWRNVKDINSKCVHGVNVLLWSQMPLLLG